MFRKLCSKMLTVAGLLVTLCVGGRFSCLLPFFMEQTGRATVSYLS